MSLAQSMMLNFLKGLGINEALIMAKMDEFAAVVKSYADTQKQINRRLDVMEQNISLIMAKLEIEEKSEKPVLGPDPRIDTPKIVNKCDAA